MDTKWKRSKTVLGFLSFALGVSLLLSFLLPIGGNLLSVNGRERLGNALKHDFQETSTFRSYLSNVMNSFITMGAGGSINDSYYGYSAYDDALLTESEAIAGTTIIQDADDSGVWYINGYPYSDRQPTEADKERWKKEAEAWSQQFQGDENLLYYITYNSQVVYTNMDRRKDSVPSFPKQGYSFRLSFDGAKCEAEKNGKKLDLYADGFYQEDGKHWFLPGYPNFLAGDGTSKVRVYMAVADEPQLYIKADFPTGGFQRQYNNEYYHHYRLWLENRQKLVLQGGLWAVLGIALLFIHHRLRREKAMADQAIARFTGHIWFEVKLLLFSGAAVLLLLPFSDEMSYLWQEVTYAVAWEDGGDLLRSSWFLRQYLSEIIRHPGAVCAAFWTGYLFVNDLRYGDKPWRHGLCGMLTARSLKLPVQKRLSRLAGLMALAALSLGCATLNLLIYYLSFGDLRLEVVWLFLFLPALLLLAAVLYVIRLRRLWGDLGALTEQITAVKEGNLTHPLSLSQDSDLGRAAEELTNIQQGMKKAVEEQTRSERMKVELITNVSHDIKTPLTSIISYTELLKQEQLEPPAGEYVDILCQKAERLRTMVLDVFEVSKAASGELPVNLEPLDLAKLLRQTTADMAETIDAAPVTLRLTLPEEPVSIMADGDRLYRVFQNLLQNALQYALEGSRVYLTLSVKDAQAEVSVKNTSKHELPDGVDFTERFVRGDPSRTDGGSGLGLAIASSFARACGGELKVEPVADLFVVTVTFPLSEKSAE